MVSAAREPAEAVQSFEVVMTHRLTDDFVAADNKEALAKALAMYPPDDGFRVVSVRGENESEPTNVAGACDLCDSPLLEHQDEYYGVANGLRCQACAAKHPE